MMAVCSARTQLPVGAGTPAAERSRFEHRRHPTVPGVPTRVMPSNPWPRPRRRG